MPSAFRYFELNEEEERRRNGGPSFFQVWKRAKPCCCHCDTFFSCPAATILPFILPPSFLPLSSLPLFPQSTRTILSSSVVTQLLLFLPSLLQPPLQSSSPLFSVFLSALFSVAFIHLNLSSYSLLFSSFHLSTFSSPWHSYCYILLTHHPFFCLKSFHF